MNLNTQIEHAAHYLPEGYTIAIEVENGSALVRLVGPSGEDQIIDIGKEPLKDQVAEALQIAREDAKGRDIDEVLHNQALECEWRDER